MTKTRNSEVLADFVAYCQAHPQERFWQALRNWSGYPYLVAKERREDLSSVDTFYLEGKRHDSGPEHK